MNPLTLSEEEIRLPPGEAGGRRKIHWRALAGLLAEHSAWLIAVLGVAIVAMETAEHLIEFGGADSFFWGEVTLFSLLLLLTGSLNRTLLKGAQAIRILQLKHDLSLELFSSQDAAEVSRRLVQQIAAVVPASKAELYLFKKNMGWFVLARAEEAPAGRRQDPLAGGLDPFPCRQCLSGDRAALNLLAACRQGELARQYQGLKSYCLPLAYAGRPVGLLHLHFPSQKGPTAGQSQVLEGAGSEMAYALHAAVESRAREDEALAQKVRAVQLEIARDLHDTIGQNVTYLQLKLHQFSEQDLSHRTVPAEDIGHMCAVADETHDLVRGTLAVLQSEQSADLLRLLARYASQVTERSAFKLDFNSQGRPKPLSPQQLRQLFLVFREALSNIEKHAGAGQVNVTVAWDEDGLVLGIADDGRGFDPAQPRRSQYGLRFMRERVEQMNGSLSILSAAGAGTNIVIHVPVGEG